LGCSDRIVAEDLDEEHAWQLSQEFRLASNFSGPLNFSVGGNYLHYETEENYYVFINALSAYTASGWNDSFGTLAGSLDNSDCLPANGGYQAQNPILGGGAALQDCVYMDPNPIGSLNNKGHNYFLSQNPYTLNSYAGFGELYYDITKDLKLTGGLRWTIDQKHFVNIPSEVVANGYGYFITGAVNQKWERPSGRVVLDWTPKLDFTDQSLVYASYSHGYKAGGANPPGAVFTEYNGNSSNVGIDQFPVHPLIFKPEYIDAYELGAKNTLLDGSLTLNGDVFYYDYKNYQISKIVDRTAINDNYNARVMGSEITADWEPAPGLRFNFAGGYEDTRINNGQYAIDLMDRTAGMPGWMVLKPFVTTASNCILPDYVVAAVLEEQATIGVDNGDAGGYGPFACGIAYNNHLDPVTGATYVAGPMGLAGAGPQRDPVPIPAGYPGFNPDTPAYNDGEGFAKPLGGNKLPNAPPFTVSFGAQYTLPLTQDWAGTARGDYYWQDYSWARVFNDNPYDRLRGYTTVNLTLIFTNQNGWQVMLYDKNVFNETAITGDFLNSDDSGLTTNIFLTDPKLIGIRVTKNW
jgi:iron complex outermembrane receptor protein